MTEKAILARLAVIKKASRELRAATDSTRNKVLERAALLLLEKQDEILKANKKDITAVQKAGRGKKKVTPAFLDRLTLSPERIVEMVKGLRQLATFPDPVGEVVGEKELKNGLHVKRVRSPLGVIFIIFESRPNVSMEAFSLAFKAGNALILRGGSESMQTTKALYSIIESALETEGLSKNCIWGIQNPDRKITQILLKQKKWIDVVVPRGGDSLIEFVSENTSIPIIKNDRGLCHVYVHEDADLAMATQLVLNAKTQRPGVCNAMETLLVHEKVAPTLLPQLYTRMQSYSVEWFVCPRSYSILRKKDLVKKATPKSWDTEYLDYKINCRVVKDVEEAIAHIEEHGSHHSEAIVTQSEEVARKFQTEVDAAAVYWNASTRFTDGYQMGLGGELGISTQKLHVRGPVGIRELTSVRWVVSGNGQVRS